MTEITNTHYYTSLVPRIDPTEKQLWIEALLSGKYKQGYEALNIDDNLCCLGVYCEVKDVPKTRLGTDGSQYYGAEDYADTRGFIPDGYLIPWVDVEGELRRVRRSGFSGADVIFQCYGQGPNGEQESWLRASYSVSSLNDSRKFTFAQIADIINYFL